MSEVRAVWGQSLLGPKLLVPLHVKVITKLGFLLLVLELGLTFAEPRPPLLWRQDIQVHRHLWREDVYSLSGRYQDLLQTSAPLVQISTL